MPDIEYYTGAYTGEEIDAYLTKAKNGSNPNLLDNWFFVGGGTGSGVFPVNQRGQASYSGNIPAFDRWRTENSGGQAISLTNAGVQIVGTSSQYQGIVQLFENPSLFEGKTVTISALFSDGTLQTASGTITLPSSNSVLFRAGSDTSGNATTFLYGSTSHFSFRIRCAVNCTKTVVAAKLELGNTQTLAHQENGVWVLNEIPNYLQELAKCQRYLLVFKNEYQHNSGATNYNKLGLYVCYADGACNLFVPTPVTMRPSSSPTVSGTVRIVRTNPTKGGLGNSTALVIETMSQSGVSLIANNSNLSIGDIGWCDIDNTTVTISCEL